MEKQKWRVALARLSSPAGPGLYFVIHILCSLFFSLTIRFNRLPGMGPGSNLGPTGMVLNDGKTRDKKASPVSEWYHTKVSPPVIFF